MWPATSSTTATSSTAPLALGALLVVLVVLEAATGAVSAGQAPGALSGPEPLRVALQQSSKSSCEGRWRAQKAVSFTWPCHRKHDIYI